MGIDDRPELTPELLNDFFAECEEHLDSIRQSVLALEKGVDQPEAATLIEHLLYRFHSLKGIVGMAGIGPAEELAHRIEDYLRELSRGKSKLTPQGSDLMAGAIQSLEQIIIAFREKQDYPDVTRLTGQIAELVSPAQKEVRATAPVSEALQSEIQEACERGFYVWKATFAPSPQLNERGINVSSIRSRLGAIGELIDSSTQVRPGGTLAFEFFVAVRESPQNLQEWTNEGVLLEPIAEPAPITSPTSPAVPPQTVAVTPSHVIRVELQRLDDLMGIAGELVVHRARLEEQISRLPENSPELRAFQEVNLGLARQFRELRETVMRLRMVPIAEIFDRMPFVVRDLTRGSRKKIRLDIEGQTTELDKYLVEQLKDPLLHLVRNAVSHGIEDSEERIGNGKPAEATLKLSAATVGETVLIEVADDGRGVDPAQVAQRAQQMGIEVPDILDDAAVLDLISAPGFSTRDHADRAAGRGVGMSVVRNTLRELGGTVSLRTEIGRGTHFTLRLPVTLLITDAFIVSSADQNFAVPQNSVEEVLEMDESKVERIEQAELVSLRGAGLRLLRLRNAFGFPARNSTRSPVLVSHTDRGKVGLVVDRIIGHRQIVVRSLRDPLIHVAGVVGATELGDGRPLLILDAAALAKANERQRKAVPIANRHLEATHV